MVASASGKFGAARRQRPLMGIKAGYPSGLMQPLADDMKVAVRVLSDMSDHQEPDPADVEALEEPGPSHGQCALG